MSDTAAVNGAEEATASGSIGRYSPLDPANLYLIQRVEAAVLRLFREEGFVSFDGLRLLDVGCGTGAWLRRFAMWGAQPERLAGIDIRPGAVHDARRLAPGVDLRQGDAAHLPWGNGTFDVVSQFTVMSSVRRAATRDRIAAEMRRALAPGGFILWYDMRLNPTNRRVVGLGENDLRALFPGWEARLRRVTLAPPLGRLVAPRSWVAARLLEALPPLRTHLLAAIRPPGPR